MIFLLPLVLGGTNDPRLDGAPKGAFRLQPLTATPETVGFSLHRQPWRRFAFELSGGTGLAVGMDALLVNSLTLTLGPTVLLDAAEPVHGPRDTLVPRGHASQLFPSAGIRYRSELVLFGSPDESADLVTRVNLDHMWWGERGVAFNLNIGVGASVGLDSRRTVYPDLRIGLGYAL